MFMLSFEWAPPMETGTRRKAGNLPPLPLVVAVAAESEELLDWASSESALPFLSKCAIIQTKAYLLPFSSALNKQLVSELSPKVLLS